jgi:hypothetical protein
MGAGATAVALLLASACSGGGGGTDTAGRSASTTPSGAATTAATGGVGPSVATTTIPGAAGAVTTAAAGTLAPQPTTTIPLTPAASDSPAPTDPADGGGAAGGDPGTDAPPPTSAPRPTSPPVTDITDGDPVAFCPAVDRAVPLYYVVSIGSLDGDAAAAAYEVAVAPALTGPLTDAANSAPSVVAAPFRRWADRTALAVAAFKSAGATDAQVASFGQAFAAEIEQLTDAGGAQSPPDPIAAATAIGVDRNQLMAAATRFAQANGTFETFAATLGQEVTLTPAAQQKLEQLFPCAADLNNFAS